MILVRGVSSLDSELDGGARWAGRREAALSVMISPDSCPRHVMEAAMVPCEVLIGSIFTLNRFQGYKTKFLTEDYCSFLFLMLL